MENHGKVSQYSQSTGRDLNPRPPEYEAEVRPTILAEGFRGFPQFCHVKSGIVP
jgi:hypothetical protein